MNLAIFYSDPAILLYECIVILALIFGILKLSRSKKQRMQEIAYHNTLEQERRLDNQLVNNKRRSL